MSTGSFDTAVLKEGRKSQEHHAVPGAFVCLFCLLWFCFVILYQFLVVHTGEGKIFLLDKALAYKRVKKKETVLRLFFFLLMFLFTGMQI